MTIVLLSTAEREIEMSEFKLNKDAARDLYESLQNMIQFAEVCRNETQDVFIQEAIHADIEKARLALEKARGDA